MTEHLLSFNPSQFKQLIDWARQLFGDIETIKNRKIEIVLDKTDMAKERAIMPGFEDGVCKLHFINFYKTMVTTNTCYYCKVELTDNNQVPKVKIHVDDKEGTTVYGICQSCQE